MKELHFSNSSIEEHFEFRWEQKVDLDDKVIAVLGGAGSLGEMFLYAAASNGATIAFADYLPPDSERSSKVEESMGRICGRIRVLGKVPLAADADVTMLDDVDSFFQLVRQRYGSLDVVVDFAGITHFPFDLFKDDQHEMLESFKRTIDINLTGSFICTMAAARLMIPQRHGHIILIGSSASNLSLYGTYGYNASKHGVAGIVKTAAAQLAPFGVRVNAVAPGTVLSNLNEPLLKKADGSFNARAMSVLAHTPTKRFLSREGVAETLIAMCAEQRHLTGNVVYVDDGYNIEGHSWPEGNTALYAGLEKLREQFEKLDREYPRER